MLKHIAIKYRPTDERPREKLLLKGSSECSLQELLAILMGSGYRNTSALQLADQVLGHCEYSIRQLAQYSAHELQKDIKGLGPAKIAQIMAGIELGKRFLKEEKKEGEYRFQSPTDIIDYVYHYLGPEYQDQKKESFYIILVNNRNRPIHRERLTIGTIDTCLVDPQEVVRLALRHNATGVVLVHNHPSGETNPSPEDLQITKRIYQCLESLSIRLLDHIIIGRSQDQYASFLDLRLF
jgi:DNA repair protein RadC